MRVTVLVSALLFALPMAHAQAPAKDDDDLDVTMRVIVDPNAKVPDEIVRKIPLPKPAATAAPGTEKPAEQGKPKENGKPDDTKTPDAKPKDTGKPADAGKPAAAPKPSGPGPAAQAAPDVREQGRAFGEQVSEDAKKRSEEARRNEKPPKPPK